MSDEELKAFSLQPLTLNIPSNTVLTECSIRDMDNLSLAITSQKKTRWHDHCTTRKLQEQNKNKADRHKSRARDTTSHYAKKSKAGQTDGPTR